MWQSNRRWLESMIQNFPAKTMLLVSWSNCMVPRVLKVLPLGKSKGWDKKEITEFQLHFKLSILFLDASTVQSGLQKLSIWGTFSFPPHFSASEQKILFSIFIHNASAIKLWTEVNTLGLAPQKGTTNCWRKLCPTLGSNEQWLPPKATDQWASSHPVCLPFVPSFLLMKLYRAALQLRVG